MRIPVWLLAIFWLGIQQVQSYQAAYVLGNLTTFAVLVLPEGNSKNWTVCFLYETTSGSDPFVPGVLPVQCDLKENPFNAFTVITANYKSKSVSVYTSQRDVWYGLAQDVSSFGPMDAMVFDFTRVIGRDFVALRDHPSTFRIPGLMDGVDQFLMLSTNGQGLRQITPSLKRTEFSTNSPSTSTPVSTTTQEITSTFETTSESLSTFETTEPTTQSIFLKSFVEESNALLPTLKRSALPTAYTIRMPKVSNANGNAIISTGTTIPVAGSAPGQSAIKLITKPTNLPTPAPQKKSTANSERSKRPSSNQRESRRPVIRALSRAPPTIVTIAKDWFPTSTAFSRLNERESSALPTSLLGRTTERMLDSTVPTSTDGLEIWESLLKPKPGSKIEVIGKAKDEDEPPELLMFDISERLATTLPPFFPPFRPPPFVSATSAPPSNITSKAPCPDFPHPAWQNQFPTDFPLFGPANPFPG